MVTRLSGGLTPADGSDPRTFPTIWNDTATDIEAAESDIDALEAKNIPSFGTATPSDGQVLAYDSGSSEYVPEDISGFPSNAYAYVDTLYFTSNDTFTKASYPWLRAIRVRCVGGGGGGGGVEATSSSEFAASGGGGGGGYAESFITDIASLSASETVTVGSGGSGGAAGANAGSGGGNTSFGSLVQGDGANGGNGRTAQTFWITSGGGDGGSGSGDLVIDGSFGGTGNPVNVNGGYAGRGGSTVLGAMSREISAWQSSNAGVTGELYGGGGSGAASGQSQTAKAGGDGADGIVIVELYA